MSKNYYNKKVYISNQQDELKKFSRSYLEMKFLKTCTNHLILSSHVLSIATSLSSIPFYKVINNNLKSFHMCKHILDSYTGKPQIFKL